MWLTTQNHSTLVTDTTVVPFLPVNPEYSSTRNQASYCPLLVSSVYIDLFCLWMIEFGMDQYLWNGCLSKQTTYKNLGNLTLVHYTSPLIMPIGILFYIIMRYSSKASGILGMSNIARRGGSAPPKSVKVACNTVLLVFIFVAWSIEYFPTAIKKRKKKKTHIGHFYIVHCSF